MKDNLFCIYGSQTKNIVTADDGKVYKLFGDTGRKTGFFQLSPHPVFSNYFTIVKFIDQAYVNSETINNFK